MKEYTVIVADGSFPVHRIPLEYLEKALRIVCCDGSAEKLLMEGYIPDTIVGDMDSLTQELAERYSDRLCRIDDQETNDLTKAVGWCYERGFTDVVILGATGKREDHTLGNISLLAEYAKNLNVIMVTDTGIFRPLTESCTISSFPGQQISIFSIDPQVEITSSGLKYPLLDKKITNWWVATLNEALGEEFRLEFQDGRLIVFIKYP